MTTHFEEIPSALPYIRPLDIIKIAALTSSDFYYSLIIVLHNYSVFYASLNIPSLI